MNGEAKCRDLMANLKKKYQHFKASGRGRTTSKVQDILAKVNWRIHFDLEPKWGPSTPPHV